jgi:hypothetical protein
MQTLTSDDRRLEWITIGGLGLFFLAVGAAHPAHGFAYALKARNVFLLTVRIFRENVPILPYFVGEWIEPDFIGSLSHPPNMLPDSPVFQPQKSATIKLTHYPAPAHAASSSNQDRHVMMPSSGSTPAPTLALLAGSQPQ